MKKLITSFLLSITLISSGLFIHSTMTYAQNQTGQSVLQDIGKELGQRNSSLPDFNKPHPKASKESGVSNITSAMYYIIEFMKYVLGSIAVLLIIISGIRLVTATSQIDEIKQKEVNHLKYSAGGLILIIISDQLIKKVLFGEAGYTLVNQETAKQFATGGAVLAQNIYRVVQSAIGALAVLAMVGSGVQYALSAGSEETTGKAKKRITWGAVALMVVGVSELVVYDIVFPNQGSEIPRIQRAGQLIASITNFASAFIATLAILGFIYAGYLYVTAGAKEDNVEKAKKTLFGSIAGILLAAAAFGIVTTLTGGLNQ